MMFSRGLCGHEASCACGIVLVESVVFVNGVAE